MNGHLRQLATLINVLGLTPSLLEAQSRQTSQAAVYLAKQLGLDLGYNFSWQSAGPYSSRLTEDLYDLASGPTTILPYRLNEDFTRRTERILRLFAVPRGVTLDESRWLLLLAATHFLVTHARISQPEMERRLRSVDAQISRYGEEAKNVLAAA
ncbi:MAG: hypothetical protein JWN27_2415 [Candidatus Eremiobacteraeota bacterium]|nr:hypothetical protein [Candidatus Eremiobacteraeota bacterium]